MPQKNSLLTGLMLALIFPAVSLIAAYVLRYNVLIVSKPSIPYFLAMALNLILLRIFYKKDHDKTVMGIILVTFAFMMAVFIFKVHLGR